MKSSEALKAIKEEYLHEKEELAKLKDLPAITALDEASS